MWRFDICHLPLSPAELCQPYEIWLLISTVSRGCVTDRQPDMTAASALILPNPLAEMLQATGGGLTWGPFDNILALSVDIRTVTHIFVWVRGY